MRYLILALGLLLPLLTFAQDEIQYKTYSYTEFFQMIEDEEDSVFELTNALIRADQKSDSMHYVPVSDFYFGLNAEDYVFESPERDTIVIHKAIKLSNVQFTSYDLSLERDEYSFIQTGFYRVKFKQPVEITNTFSVLFQQSTFEKGLSIQTNKDSEILKAASLDSINNKAGLSYYNENVIIESSHVQGLFDVKMSLKESADYFLVLKNSRFPAFDLNHLINLENFDFYFSQNEFENLILSSKNSSGAIRNSLVKGVTSMGFTRKGRVIIQDNQFEGYVLFGKDPDKNVTYIMDWVQWFGKYLPSRHGRYQPNDVDMNDINRSFQEKVFGQVSISRYQDSIRVANKQAYRAHTQELAEFYNQYKLSHDTENANLVYREIKNLETQRLAYLYDSKPSFDSFFSWKINQFLKIFSAYGTKPSRAIIFSVYVILAFALVYLFFPNYWDSHGKNRIKDRFLFFHKYLRHNKGIQDVYLEEQQAELQSAYAFQQVLDKHKAEVPNFFYSAAKPLYRWSVAGTTLYAKLLSRVDFLKGSWKETDPKKRKLRTALTIVVFVFALLYDIFIKVLNALMLSINTFTTLGFGEIPIKGLPRYLAIIQGFIGWFMLTIFSVSLISQLLN